jgi:hypothetical protein
MTQERPGAIYRLYFLDWHNHIEDVEVLDCASDQEALSSAEKFVNGREIELWDRARFISRLPRKAGP